MAQPPRPGSISFEDRVTKSPPFEWGFGSTPRTAGLRDQLVWKAAVTKEWISVALGLGKSTYRQGQNVRIDLDRARLVTCSYRETETEPPAIRRAKALETLCEEMPIFIQPGELIVGDPNGAPDEIRWYPEISMWWMPDAVTTGGFSEMVDDGERKEIVEDICAYWQGRCLRDRVVAALPRDLASVLGISLTEGARRTGGVSCTVWEEGRTVPCYDFESLFREGLAARIRRVEEKLERLEEQASEIDPAEYLEKRNNWRAMAISGRAVLRYAERHADLAREQAAEEGDPVRRRELEEIAAILDRVPAHPPRTFHECLQFFWIVDVAAHHLAVCGNGSGVRIDQVWWPCYAADMEAGRLTREQALELVECLFLKIQGLGSPPEWPKIFNATSGFDVTYTANICGTDENGRDASNDLSCIVLEALANLHVNQPPVALRYHRNISPEVVERAIDLVRTGMGHPGFFNEDLLEKWALRRGWPPEIARRTQAAGCVAPNIPGTCSVAVGLGEVGGVVHPKLLEEVLGLIEPPEVPGRPETRDPREMQSADELLDAFCARLLFYARVAMESWNIGHQVILESSPDPCNSFLTDETLERGLDLARVHKEHDTWPNMITFGAINLSDSLAAIQKLVFDEKRYTMDELLRALQANWEGHERMRRDFLDAPKYGNDDEVADGWAAKCLVRLHDTVSRVKDAWGYPLTFDGSTAAAYQVAGLTCGAGPDGRLAHSYLADGSLSPMAGADQRGPTAVLNSVGKIPFLHTQLLNQRFLPQLLEGKSRKLFADYLRSWYDKGTIPHIQFNVVDSRILRDAQEHPDRYPDLQVRVAGYSAFWIDLPRETQDSIIARTAQSLD